MRPRRFTLLAIGVAVSVLMNAASAQAADPLVGTWKLSLSKSKLGPDPGLKSAIIQVEEDGDTFRVRLATIDTEGKPATVSYSVKKDGKEYPVSGPSVPNGTTIWRRIDERTTEMIALQHGKELNLKRVVVSPDGRTQTVTQSGSDSEGHRYSIVYIWEKQ
jgi:hypothetical protein